MFKESLIFSMLLVSSVAHAQSSGGPSPLPEDIAKVAPRAMPKVDKLIVKLKDGGRGAGHVDALADRQDRAADVEALIERVRARRFQNRAITAFGSVAAAAQGAVGDPADGLTIDRALVKNKEYVLNMQRPTRFEDAEALAKDFQALDGVEYAEVDHPMFALKTPESRQYSKQWALRKDGGGANFASAWTITTGDSRDIVAVLDTGVLPHGNLAGKLLPGYDFISNPVLAGHGRGRNRNASDPGDWVTTAETGDPRSILHLCAVDEHEKPIAQDSSWHGTHVAGTVGASAQYGPGIAGGTWNGAILPVRVLGRCGRGDTSDILDGIRWSAGLHVDGVRDNPNPAKVLNLSFGGVNLFGCPASYQSAIDDVIARGVTVVAAAGNSMLVHGDWAVPASCKGVIAVGAHDADGDVAYNSTRLGKNLLLTAPGVGILSTSNTGRQGPVADGYVRLSGTSMAAPHVSAAVSLMRSVNPNLTLAQIRDVLKGSATPHLKGGSPICFNANSPGSNLCGAGRLNAGKAVFRSKVLPFMPRSD